MSSFLSLVRTVLLAIIGFMPTEGVGAIGSMDCPAEERRRMARRSVHIPYSGKFSQVKISQKHQNAFNGQKVCRYTI